MIVAGVTPLEMAGAMAVALALGLALLALRPSDRASTRNALLLLGVCAIATLADMALASTGAARAAGLASDAANVLVGVVLIRLATILVFRVVLPAAGSTTPRRRLPNCGSHCGRCCC